MRLFGHPVHPMLVALPLGLFIGAIIIDTIYLFTGNTTLPSVSYFNISLGILGGLLAAIFGFTDWLALPANTRAKQIGGWHGIGNMVVILMFALSWWSRRASVNFEPSQLALIFSYCAILFVVVTAWLGGEMVFRLNVAVDRGANYDAPSSLSDKPASPGSKVSMRKQQAKR